MLSVGIPKEIKVCENRVSMIPDDIKKIVDSGILVYFQKGAGINSGYNDYEYIEVGTIMVDTIEELYTPSDMEHNLWDKINYKPDFWFQENINFNLPGFGEEVPV